jgi:general secretion pathway protein E
MSTDTHAALAAPAGPALRSLPFAFAKRHGVLLREPFGQPQLQVRRGASLAAVQEAQRFAGRVLPLHWLEPEAFEQELTLAYQRDSSEVRQMAEGLGAELDLASLAELTPESGDLLEQEDDAPIIRLINAILSEAINAGA